jgi:nucleoside-diphosphate-sugar epimerase
MPATPLGLTVAVTGPTGTIGFGLLHVLEADDRIARIVGIARRPFDPTELGWTKTVYRQGDVRDRAALADAFRGADVVVHLAFQITGTGSRATTRTINVDGTINAFRAAADAGAARFVYTSSAAAYGFRSDNPIGMTEDWPTRPDPRFFYAQEKAELEQLLRDEADTHPHLGLYLLRPPIVLGPHAVGAKDFLPEMLHPLVHVLGGFIRRPHARLPLVLPAMPLQFVHEDDVGQAIALCVVGAGPAGAYNIAGDGTLTTHDVARELGFTPIPVPLAAVERAARALASVPLPPFVPPLTGWIAVASHPAVIDTAKAKRDLGWQPRYSGLDALRQTLHPSDRPPGADA